jgi:hypothetical protein
LDQNGLIGNVTGANNHFHAINCLFHEASIVHLNYPNLKREGRANAPNKWSPAGARGTCFGFCCVLKQDSNLNNSFLIVTKKHQLRPAGGQTMGGQ